MFGSKGNYFGMFSAHSLRMIKALALQHPATSMSVPDVDHVNSDTVNALVDFHEGNYCFPERFGTLAHQVMAADILGDDTFVMFVAERLKVPSTRLNSSHRFRMIIRDRMRLKRYCPLSS